MRYFSNAYFVIFKRQDVIHNEHTKTTQFATKQDFVFCVIYFICSTIQSFTCVYFIVKIKT